MAAPHVNRITRIGPPGTSRLGRCRDFLKRRLYFGGGGGGVEEEEEEDFIFDK